MAEITVPSSVQPYKPIVISVKPSGIPDGAQVRGSVTSSTADLLPGPSAEVWHCWAKPGTHSVVASGVWVLTQEVQFGEQSVKVLVDFGQFSETAAFVVEGSKPEPEPDPDPPDPLPPPTDRWVIIIEETSERTPSQAALYNQIRQELTGKLVIADRDSEAATLRRYAELVDDELELPVVFVVGSDGRIYSQVQLPGTLDEIRRLMQ